MVGGASMTGVLLTFVIVVMLGGTLLEETIDADDTALDICVRGNRGSMNVVERVL